MHSFISFHIGFAFGRSYIKVAASPLWIRTCGFPPIPSCLNMPRGPLAFMGSAALCGMILHTLYFVAFHQSNTTHSSISSLQPSPWKDNDNPSTYSQDSCTLPPVSTQYLTVTADAPAPTARDSWVTMNDMTLEEIREMVSKTKGLFTRDFSLGLGWNNVGSSCFANIPILFTKCIDALYSRSSPSTCYSVKPNPRNSLVRILSLLRV